MGQRESVVKSLETIRNDQKRSETEGVYERFVRGQRKKQGLVAPYFFSTEDTPSPFKLPFKLHMHVKVRVNKVKYT